MKQQRKFHPVADVFPLLKGAEFDALVDSIKVTGLLNAITLHPDGRIIDGRNRERACAEAGVEPRYETWDGKGSLIAFAVAQNNDRRHLNGTQRALLGKQLEALYAAEAKERQLAAGARGREGGRGRKKTVEQKVSQGKREEQAREKAAKAARTNPAYISMLKKIEAEAPAVYAKIVAGEIDLPKARRLVQQAKAEQRLEAAKLIERPAIERVDLRVCGMDELLGDVGELDAIITDPPYSQKDVPLYEQLARLAKRALKRDGVLCVMTGLTYLPEILAAMSKHMPYRWSLAYIMPGQATQVFPRHVNCHWKLALVFGGGKWIADDVVNAEQDKRFHAWGQGEGGLGRIIDLLTEPDALVCDPFLGAGTTAVAAIRLHRRVIGCDTDEAQVKTVIARTTLALEETVQ
jgi:16S rRNA G966 N2-methylase RsmD